MNINPTIVSIMLLSRLHISLISNMTTALPDSPPLPVMDEETEAEKFHNLLLSGQAAIHSWACLISKSQSFPAPMPLCEAHLSDRRPHLEVSGGAEK